MADKTHREVKTPRLSDNKLADYMNASEQARRNILRTCKYQAIAAIIQHRDAKKMITESMLNGNVDHNMLSAKLETYRGSITDTEFEAQLKDYNIDYVNSVLKAAFEEINGAEFERCKAQKKLDFNGTEISFWPDILIARTNRRNNRRIGALNLRYSKSAKLPEKAAEYQSSLVFGVLKGIPFEAEATPELDLCQTIDGSNGKVYVAPTNAIYCYNEMKAACGAIAYQWPNIEPPKGAIF